MKKEYNNTLIYYIRTLKEQKLIKDWTEGTKIYYELEGKEITGSALSTRAKNILVTQDINPISLSDYYKYTPKLLEKDEETMMEESTINKTEKGLISEVLVKTLSLKISDLGPVFGVDIENDTPDVVRNKVMTKFGDEIFALTYFGKNPATDYIQKCKYGSWTTTLNIKQPNGGSKSEVVVNEKIELTIVKRANVLNLITKEDCDNWLQGFLNDRGITPFDLFESNYRNMAKKVKDEALNDDLLMVVPGLEVHLGKLGAVSDFEDFSTAKAMWRIKKTWEEVVAYQLQNKASTLLLGVGNDYFNSDTVDDKTTAGTPQNNDTRFKEIYLWGKVGMLRGIETAKPYYKKVVVKGNPGNHDEKSSFSLFSNIYDIYNVTKDPKVEVTSTFQDLRFTTSYEHGDNLIVLSHGKSPESRNLSDVELARAVKYQFPEEYNRARNVYVLAGHLHTDSEHKFDKVTVLRSAALTGIENWHANNLYISQRQGSTIYLFDKERGYVGKKNVTLTENDKKQKISNINRDPKTDVQSAMEKAIDIDADKARLLNLAKNIKRLDNHFSKVNKDYSARFENIIRTLGVSEVNEEQKQAILDIMGYNNELELANLELVQVAAQAEALEDQKVLKLVRKVNNRE